MSKTTTTTTRVSSKSQFLATAGQLTIFVGSGTMSGGARIFSEGKGNCGWYVNGKTVAHWGGELLVDVCGTPVMVPVHSFKTGSHGWYTNGGQCIPVTLQDGTQVHVEVKGNFTIIGSKGGPAPTPGQAYQVQVGISIVVLGSKAWPV